MIYLKLLTIGIIGGFVSSAPLGPINLLIAESCIGKKTLKFRHFLSGVFVADMLFAFIAIIGYYAFFTETNWGKGINIIGSVFIIILGLYIFKSIKKPVITTEDQEIKPNPLSNFIKGFFLCFSNPAFLVWWLFVAHLIEQKGISNITHFQVIFILLGIVIGDLIWFSSFIKLVKTGAKKLNSNIIIYVRYTIAIFLVLLGISTIISSLI